ncbi:MAG: hypothetical protein ACRBDI_08050 [Alphaproteobacteria bacterium]
MILELLSMENVFGKTEAMLYLDEILSNYDKDEVSAAVENGYIETRVICIGPDCGRILCHLSEKGRCKANESMH